MLIEEREIAPYRKKAKKKNSKKSDHKHRYEDCAFEIPSKWYIPHQTEEELFVLSRTELIKGQYCIICGKIGQVSMFDAPVVKEPKFKIISPFEKYIKIEKREN